MSIWEEIKKLEGQILRTLDQKKPFEILDVRESGVLICPYAPQFIEDNTYYRQVNMLGCFALKELLNSMEL